VDEFPPNSTSPIGVTRRIRNTKDEAVRKKEAKGHAGGLILVGKGCIRYLEQIINGQSTGTLE
jgi:hypothetical protein